MGVYTVYTIYAVLFVTLSSVSVYRERDRVREGLCVLYCVVLYSRMDVSVLLFGPEYLRTVVEIPKMEQRNQLNSRVSQCSTEKVLYYVYRYGSKAPLKNKKSQTASYFIFLLNSSYPVEQEAARGKARQARELPPFLSFLYLALLYRITYARPTAHSKIHPTTHS